MTPRFHVGQRVRVVRRQSPHYGEVATITSDLHWLRARRRGEGSVASWFYETDLPPLCPETRVVIFRPHEIVPYDPPKLSSWSDLAHIWTPKGVSA